MRSLLATATLLAAFLCAPHASAQVFPIPGSGCPNAGPCAAIGNPGLGQTICFAKPAASSCVPGSIPFIIFGAPGGPIPIQPPLACTPFGTVCMLSCTIINTFGTPQLCLTIPNNTALVGQCFCIQCGCVHPNPFCLQFCQALRVCITP
jgi:hypothetical protein